MATLRRSEFVPGNLLTSLLRLSGEYLDFVLDAEPTTAVIQAEASAILRMTDRNAERLRIDPEPRVVSQFEIGRAIHAARIRQALRVCLAKSTWSGSYAGIWVTP